MAIGMQQFGNKWPGSGQTHIAGPVAAVVIILVVVGSAALIINGMLWLFIALVVVAIVLGAVAVMAHRSQYHEGEVRAADDEHEQAHNKEAA